MSQALHPAVPLSANARPTLGRGVHDLVADVVRDRPDTTAVMERPTGQRVTYRQLWDRSGRLAGTLADLGVGRGDVVAVAQPRGVDLVVAFLGILRAGATYLPVDDHAPADRVAAMLAQAGAEVAVVSADTLGPVPAAHLVASPRDGDPVSPRAVAVGGDDPA